MSTCSKCPSAATGTFYVHSYPRALCGPCTSKWADRHDGSTHGASAPPSGWTKAALLAADLPIPSDLN